MGKDKFESFESKTWIYEEKVPAFFFVCLTPLNCSMVCVIVPVHLQFSDLFELHLV